MAKYQKIKPYNPLVQIGAMNSFYPQFVTNQKRADEIEFIGNLHVKPELPIYNISVTYRGDLRPKVKVLKPDLVENPPHCYPDDTLCLYHKENYHWKGAKLIAKYIIPWVAAWIYFYEVWKQTGIWYGPEVPHTTPKTEE